MPHLRRIFQAAGTPQLVHHHLHHHSCLPHLRQNGYVREAHDFGDTSLTSLPCPSCRVSETRVRRCVQGTEPMTQELATRAITKVSSNPGTSHELAR